MIKIIFYFIKNNIIIKNIFFGVIFGVVVGMKKNMVIRYLNFGVENTPNMPFWVGDALKR